MAINLQPRAVSESQVIMTELVLPQHTNALGTIFGGQIMAWVDIAAAITAQRHARSPVVTASVDALNFVAPVKRGWVINLKSSVNFVAKTSMEIGVRVDAENPTTGEKFHTASAYLTFVALGIDSRPTEVPKLILENDEQRRRNSAAQARRQSRLSLRAAGN